MIKSYVLDDVVPVVVVVRVDVVVVEFVVVVDRVIVVLVVVALVAVVILKRVTVVVIVVVVTVVIDVVTLRASSAAIEGIHVNHKSKPTVCVPLNITDDKGLQIVHHKAHSCDNQLYKN